MRSKMAVAEADRQTIDVELDSADVDEEFKRAYRRYRKELVVPGFRKGRAPDSILTVRFGDRIREEVQDSLVRAYTVWALDEQNIHATDAPNVTAEAAPEQGKPFHFTVVVKSRLLPRVRGHEKVVIEIEPQKTVTEEDVEDMIERLRRRVATLKLVDAPDAVVSEGDRVTVDVAFLGRETQEVLLSAPGEAFNVSSGETRLFGQKLVGRRPEEELVFDYRVPDDFPDEKFRGTDVKASIKIREVKRLHLPEKDDSLAKLVGEADTLEELRQYMRKRLDDEYERDYRRQKEEAVFKRLVEMNPIDVEPQLLERRLDMALRRMTQEGLIKEGLSDEELGKLAESIRPIVLDTVLREMITGQIGVQEGLAPSREEIVEFMNAQRRDARFDMDKPGYLVEKVRAELWARSQIIERRVKHYLFSNVEVKHASGAPKGKGGSKEGDKKHDG